jgi:hypothetical protein
MSHTIRTQFLASLFLGFLPATGFAQDSSNTTQTAEQSQKTLPSPYFVVGFRCEGITAEVTDFLSILNAEQRKRIAQSRELDLCERAFSYFGVEKYSWISPDDLEKTELRLARYDVFAKPQLKVIAAEAPGQVYLQLKLGKRTPTHVSASLDSTVYGHESKKGIGGFETSGSAAFTNMSLRPVQKLTLGTDFSLLHSTDKLDMETSEGNTSADHSLLRGRLWMHAEQALSSRWYFASTLALNMSSASNSNRERLTALANATYLITSPDEDAVVVRVGPSIGYYNNAALGGLKFDVRVGDTELNYMAMSAEGLSSSDKKYAWGRYSLDIQKVFPSAGNFLVGYENTIAETKNMKLADLGNLSLNETNMSSGLKLGKAFLSENNLHKVFLRFGAGAYSPGEGSFINTGVGYTMRTEDLDVNLSCNYISWRNF